MKRFIPAWYSRNRWWESTSRPFYLKKQYTDFDDMISLMTMHSSNNVDYQLIVLSFSPYLRTFLHRYDLYESHYWSVFDLSLIHISEPTRPCGTSRMPSSA